MKTTLQEALDIILDATPLPTDDALVGLLGRGVVLDVVGDGPAYLVGLPLVSSLTSTSVDLFVGEGGHRYFEDAA